MNQLILAFILSIASVLLITPFFLRLLQKLKCGQPIHELGPETHQSKHGTPVMGGLMFAVVTSAIALLFMLYYGFSVSTLVLVAFCLLIMVVGFADDYIKVKSQKNLGLIWWKKIIGQAVIGFLFSLYCYLSPAVGSVIIVPFFNVSWDLGVWYIPLMMLTIILITNSANLQDGLDGLLSSVAIIGNVAWALIAMFFIMTADAAEASGLFAIIFFSVALAGSLMAFLRYNFHPAKIFMGDTGSMFIGGAMVGIAMLLRLPLLLILIAFTMIMSSVSVIIQRTYYKITKGKRIFKMSPIHYHFEKNGMTEPQIVVMYSVITGILSMIAVLSLPWM